MSMPTANGTREVIDGETRVYYDGYWIKHYDPPPDTMETRKGLIQALTRRLFNHVEYGINVPGNRLEAARAAYQAETDTERKRVNGAMLAGALFNRATDIFTCLVELKGAGVEITPDNTLMRECGQCLMEALDLGKMVRHRGGDEGIDELWGEPFKAFSIKIEAFYESRYIKMAMTMRDIDRISVGLKDAFSNSTQIPAIAPRVDALAEAGKRKCEMLRTDPGVFRVWPGYVVARERLCNIQPRLPAAPNAATIREALEGARLIREGADLVTHIVRARVPMPKSTREFLDRCHQFRQAVAQANAERSPKTPRR
ncbi:MAG TPA: hypothetical protein VES73_05950 [Lamprocystis sp. (in: g-proteobacteria)]|nr:hypothetical protein [Lamprocystis sp. (in: g-proteobacteria)]